MSYVKIQVFILPEMLAQDVFQEATYIDFSHLL